MERKSLRRVFLVIAQGQCQDGGSNTDAFDAVAMNKTLKILRTALDASPDNWETRRHLVELLEEEGDTDGAMDLLLAAPAVPLEADDELFAAERLLPAHPSKAAPLVDRALRRDKSDARAHWLKAQVFQTLGLSEDARKHYTTATVLDETFQDAAFEAALEGESPAVPSAGAPVVAIPEEPRAPVAASDPEPTTISEPEPEAEFETEPEPDSEREGIAAPALVTGAAPVLQTAQAVVPQVAVPEATAWSAASLAQRMERSQQEAKKKNRVVSVLFAGILHALVILLCLFWILKPGPLPEPSVIMAMKAPETMTEKVEKKAIAQNLPQRPSSSSASRAQVLAAKTTSPLAVPEIEIENITDDILGAGDSFGMGSGWGDGMGGGGGGSVQFFGEEKKAKRVCYIVDFSYSMNSGNVEGETRREVLKRELVESINKLDPSMRYTVIFFSGMPWLQGERPGDRAVVGRQGMQDISLDVTWYDASKKNKQATIDAIQGMALAGQATGGGTIWMSGFRPAMGISPKPDLVFLLTDGMCQDYINMPNASYEEYVAEFIKNTKAWETFLQSMVELVPVGVAVNTIAMEVPGTVAARLAELAQKTGGDFSIVYEGKTYTGKRALRFGDDKYDEEAR